MTEVTRWAGIVKMERAMAIDDVEIRKIEERISNAFKPFRCVAEIWDYKDKLRFRVYDSNGQTILERPFLLIQQLRDSYYLQDVLDEAKEEAECKGFHIVRISRYCSPFNLNKACMPVAQRRRGACAARLMGFAPLSPSYK